MSPSAAAAVPWFVLWEQHKLLELQHACLLLLLLPDSLARLLLLLL
jgi:hypothetical protein